MVAHVNAKKVLKMANIFQKIFLPKDKVLILDAIEQNAARINYDYREEAPYKHHTMVIFSPTVILRSKLSTNTFTSVTLSSYYFELMSKNGATESVQSDESTLFSDRIHHKMFMEYIKHNGLDSIYNVQEAFRQQHQKQK